MTLHRNNGETRDCMGCRYWSEMIARCHSGPVEAMCLNQTSIHRSKYTSAREHCAGWASGHLGAIDEPGADPQRYQGEAA